MKKQKSKEHVLYPNYFIFPALIVFGTFYMMPILLSFVMSVTDWNIKRLYTPKWVGLKNFTYIFKDEYFILSLKNTLHFAVVTTLTIVLIGLILALVLNKAIKGRNILRTIFYLPAVLSFIIIGIMFTSVLKMNGGILNQFLILIGFEGMVMDWLGNPDTALNCIIFVQIWRWSGFAMAIFLAGLQGISNDYYEAARIDGANAWQQFRSVTFPLLAPAFTIVVTMNTIGGFKVFEQVYVLTNGGPGNATQVLSTYIYKAFGKGTLGRSTAMGVVLFVLVAGVSLILNNLLRKREIEN